MSIAIICQNKDPKPWISALRHIAPDLDIQVWPNIEDKDKIEFALCWKHPRGLLNEFSNLRCICSMGAGVDHMMRDDRLPQNVPVTRLVDPQLAQSMFEYLDTVVMYYVRDLDIYRKQQLKRDWLQQAPRSRAQYKIGIMGLGQLGRHVAQEFSHLGFSVSGWSRSAKQIDGVICFSGREQLSSFLSDVNILICLLPLTSETQDILNAECFGCLPKGACVINVARGEHLNESDLMLALHSGQLRAACLDVFQQEPLSADHPFWLCEDILLTPHCSSLTDPSSVAPQILENYQRMLRNEELLNRVDMARGY